MPTTAATPRTARTSSVAIDVPESSEPGDSIDIEVDGGITAETAPVVAQAGANVLVAGSAVFKGGKPDMYRANIAAIRNAAALARGEAA